MGYRGIVTPIPMGLGGLRTDDAQGVLRPTDLIVANNVNFHSNLIEKDAGSTRFNTNAIPSGVLAAYDWWPTFDIADRRLIVVGGDGKVYAIDNSGVETEVTPSGLNQVATLQVTNPFFMIAAGKEVAANNRKLFIFNGLDRPQVISGTPGNRYSLLGPDADWSGTNQPSAAFLHRGALYAFGNRNNPHTVYRSAFADHEDFASASPTTENYNVYTGDGDGLVGAFVFRGKVFLLKRPGGLYGFVDTDPSVGNWYFQKTSSGLGTATPNGVVQALNDVLVKTPTDTINSVSATDQFGDVKAGDALEIMNIAQFIRENTNPEGVEQTHAIYYAEKKTVYMSYRSQGSTVQDRMLSIRLDTRGEPKAAWITKDAPRCLALRKDTDEIERPIYGSLDGYVYFMDQDERNVNGAGFLGEFQTPHMDLGFVDARVAGQLEGKNKIFDFLELRYYPQGNYAILVDVFIDQNYSETLVFQMDADDLLAEPALDQDDDFMLSEDANDPLGSLLAGETVKSLKRQLHGYGRTISFRVYNSGLDESFKIEKLLVGYRPSGQQEKN